MAKMYQNATPSKTKMYSKTFNSFDLLKPIPQIQHLFSSISITNASFDKVL